SYIDKARRLVDGAFASQIGESYKRAYTTMTMVQQLVELEEIVEYKKWVLTVALLHCSVPAWKLLMEKWKQRLQGCAPSVSVWQNILAVRGLILTPEEDINSWLQFASLCRLSKNFELSRKV
ncbi:unnamed protein product, partial [Discosporangium mesarthrocarpum]